jgi:hypothetical protein
LNWEQLINFYDLSEHQIEKLGNKYKLPTAHVKSYAQADPSPKGKYVPWIMKNLADSDKINKTPMSRLMRLDHNLKVFHNNQQKIPAEHRDIYKHDFNTLHDLAKQYEPEGRLPSKLPEGSELEHKEGPYHFVRVTTPEASHKLCKDSGWCIGRSDHPHAKNYLKDSSLHVVYKDGKRFAGVHSESGVYNDKQNQSHSPEAVQDMIKHWPQERARISETPEKSYNHVSHYGTFPEAEDTIATDPQTALNYARNIKRGRFEKGEAAINNNQYTKQDYARFMRSI